MTDYDAVIIGAGHNGLVCASYLAKAGKKVLVVDGRSEPGGCASTREFTPGFRVSDCAQWLSQFDQSIIKDLDLKGAGLTTGKAKATISLQADGNHLILEGDSITGAGVDSADQAAYRDFKNMVRRFAKLMTTLYRSRPPKLVEQNWTDRLTLIKLGIGLKLLGREYLRDLMRIVMINIYDVMNEHFSNAALKSAIALDAVTGTNMGPRSPNTVFSYLHRATGEHLGQSGTTQVMGGMGALGRSLAAAAERQGVTVQLDSAVSAIVKTEDRVTGVSLTSGETISATLVISSADPTTTFRDLLGYDQMEAGMAKRVEHYRSRSGTAKLHLALSALPTFNGLSASQLSERLVITPSMDGMETALNPMKYRELSELHTFDISIASVEDPSLAPSGQHVLTAIVHYVPYAPDIGWDAGKPKLLNHLLSQLEAYAPGIGALVTASELVVPSELEASHGMTGGNWHHGELSIDQALMMRPFPGSTQYATAVEGLYLCGAGAHPGGGLQGLPGRNAAKEILRRGVLS
jgi:phytoene dehydrogenase-like protein